MTKFFDTTPKPGFLRAMQSQKWNVPGALAELVDNSFGSGRGNADNVWIRHDTTKRIVTVLDDGQGMEAIGRLFQLGNTIGLSPGDIGTYGSGGTMAILWLPSKVEVWSLKDGQMCHDSITWAEEIKADQYPKISDEWQTATIGNTPVELFELGHGTFIKLHLAKERSFQPANVKRDLARLYAPALRHGKKITWSATGRNAGSEEVLADPIVFPEDDKIRRFNVVVRVDGIDLRVAGEVGVIPDLSQEQSRINIGFGPRVITRTRDCFSSPDGSEQYSGTGVTGYLDLDDGWQDFLCTTKDGVKDQGVWDALMGHVFEKIQSLLKDTDDENLSIILDDIAINLESIFDGDAHVELPAAAGKHKKGDGGGGGHGGGGGGFENKDDPSEEDGDDTTREEDAGATRIRIVRVTDEELESALCTAEVTRHTIEVWVNKDHEMIQTAMMKKPINKSFLNYTVIREVAVEVAKHGDVARRVFPPRVIKQLEEKRDDPRYREKLITRMLLDRIRAA
jgi:hypothetical protein